MRTVDVEIRSAFNARRQNKPIWHVCSFLRSNNLQNLNLPSPSLSLSLSFAHQQLSVITKLPQKAVDGVKRGEGESRFRRYFISFFYGANEHNENGNEEKCCFT